jgi:transmembrane sensor
MSNIFKFRTRQEIDEEAAAWAWRMDAASSADREAFEAWLCVDPRHRRAFDDVSQVWNALDGLGESRGARSAAEIREPGSSHWQKYGWAAAAALVIAIAAALWSPKGHDSQTFATAVGQERSVTLADGSVVALNTNTLIETRLKARSREVYLRHGEAHFQVAHDGSRPFLVHAGDTVVRAVGTQFEVRVLADRQVDVVVNEGRVEVSVATSTDADHKAAVHRTAPGAVRALRAGQQLSTVGGDYTVTPVSSQQLSSALAWREGAIIFDGASLAEAVTEIQRYTDARIVVSDPLTAQMRVGGRFRTGDIQEFLDALQAALPVSIRRGADGAVFIDPRR